MRLKVYASNCFGRNVLSVVVTVIKVFPGRPTRQIFLLLCIHIRDGEINTPFEVLFYRPILRWSCNGFVQGDWEENLRNIYLMEFYNINIEGIIFLIPAISRIKIYSRVDGKGGDFPEEINRWWRLPFEFRSHEGRGLKYGKQFTVHISGQETE